MTLEFRTSFTTDLRRIRIKDGLLFKRVQAMTFRSAPRKKFWPGLTILTVLCTVGGIPSGAVGSEGETSRAFPAPLGYVSDYGDFIDAAWQRRIREVCKELEDRTGVEMIVVTTATIDPYTHAREYAEKLYAAWRIGTAQQERGILLLASLQERQAVVVLGRSLLSVIGTPQLDDLSTRHLVPMFQNAQYGEALYRTAVGFASASGSLTDEAGQHPQSSSAGFWMNLGVALTMMYVLWRFTRPERKHPFQRWRRGEYWGTGQGGFGGNFGGFGGGTGGRELS